MTTERKQHIGYRVVRTNPETGDREWFTPMSRWLANPLHAYTFSLLHLARDAAKRHSGRVVRVTLEWRE